MEKILILDCGSQYTGLIARRVREEGVYSEIIPATLKSFGSHLDNETRGIILSGGPHCSLHTKEFHLLAQLKKTKIPLLGICFGFQWMAVEAGGKLIPAHDMKEYGLCSIQLLEKNPLFEGIPSEIKVWMSHQDAVTKEPSEVDVLARSDHHISSIAFQNKPWYGVQFHPEVHHSEYGRELLRNFLFNICMMSSSWNPESQIETILSELKNHVKKGKIIQAVSGGVDSTVAAVLLEKALPGQTVFVTVDTGLLREKEAESVVENFHKHFSIPVQIVDYQKEIISELRRISDPEKKRKIIGHAFIKAFQDFLRDYPKVEFLGQGTLYPDVIESVSVVGPAHTIKSHHNVGGLPKNLKLKLVEPLRMLYKDEVRQLGRHLGIPEEMLERKPFPGPGLAIRIIGSVTKKKLEILRKAHIILESEMEKSEEHGNIWQAFPVLLNTKSVGVKGDQRSYDYVIALRIVESRDGMTARWLPVENKILEKVMGRMVNEIQGIGRVVLDLTSKPPGTIEWE